MRSHANAGHNATAISAVSFAVQFGDVYLTITSLLVHLAPRAHDDRAAEMPNNSIFWGYGMLGSCIRRRGPSRLHRFKKALESTQAMHLEPRSIVWPRRLRCALILGFVEESAYIRGIISGGEGVESPSWEMNVHREYVCC